MKKLLAGLAVAAATVTATAAVSIPTAADAQPRRWEGPRYWHGPARGPGYHQWRTGYYGHHRRYPVRTCTIRHHSRVCYYR